MDPSDEDRTEFLNTGLDWTETFWTFEDAVHDKPRDPTAGRGYCRCECEVNWVVDYQAEPAVGRCERCDRMLRPFDMRKTIAQALTALDEHRATLERWRRQDETRAWEDRFPRTTRGAAVPPSRVCDRCGSGVSESKYADLCRRCWWDVNRGVVG
jgi:hypothetical protein